MLVLYFAEAKAYLERRNGKLSVNIVLSILLDSRNKEARAVYDFESGIMRHPTV